MPSEIVVGVLWRSVLDLSKNELDTLERTFPGELIRLVRIDSIDSKTHLETCEREKPAMVVLPPKGPILMDAIKAGFSHVDLSTGRIRELVSFTPDFRVYIPPGQFYESVTEREEGTGKVL